MTQDHRMSLYLGAGERGRALQDPIVHYGATERFRKSEMAFVRYCIEYALAHDSSLKEHKKPAKT